MISDIMSMPVHPAEPTNIRFRISGDLCEHVRRTVAKDGYESVSEYVRDLIRKDKAALARAAFKTLPKP